MSETVLAPERTNEVLAALKKRHQRSFTISLSQFKSDGSPNSKRTKSYPEFIAAVKDHKDGPLSLSIEQVNKEEQQEISQAKLGIGSLCSLEIKRGSQGRDAFLISDLEIGSLHCGSGGRITIKSCRIGELSLNMDSRLVSFENCLVGMLSIHVAKNTPVPSFSFKDCHICEVRSAYDFSAVDIEFQDTKISKKNISLKKHLASQLELPRLNRNSMAVLYEWAERSKNSQLAHLARGTELGIERTKASGLEWLVLTLWGIFSNYGLNPARALGWLAAIIFAFSLLLFQTGTELGLRSDQLFGWRAALEGDCLTAQALRAGVGALEGIASPFSVFSFRRLVIPSVGWVAALNVVFNYLSLALVFLFVLGLRRRFKF